MTKQKGESKQIYMVKRVKTRIIDITGGFKALITEQKLIYMCVLSIFLPFFLVILPMVAYVFYILSKKKFVKQMINIKGSYFLFAFLCIAIISPVLYKNYVGILGGVFLFFCMLLALRVRCVLNKKMFNDFIVIISALSVVSFVVALIQRLIYGAQIDEAHVFRAFSTFYNTNYYAFIIDIVILACAYKIMNENKNRIFYFSVILINFTGLILSLNRSSYAAIFLGVITMAIFTKKKKALFKTLGILLVFAACVYFMPDIIPRRSSLAINADTRIKIFETAIKGIKLTPFFGRGLWGYRQVVGIVSGEKALTAHSIFLDPVLSFGFVGVTCLLAYFMYQMKALGENAKKYFLNNEKAFVIALIVTTLIHNTLDLPIVGIQTVILPMILLGICGTPAVSNSRIGQSYK